jgi:hypothetical protein
MLVKYFCPRLRGGRLREYFGLDFTSILVVGFSWTVVWFFLGPFVGLIAGAVAWAASWWINRKERGRVTFFIKRISLPLFIGVGWGRKDE